MSPSDMGPLPLGDRKDTQQQLSLKALRNRLPEDKFLVRDERTDDKGVDVALVPIAVIPQIILAGVIAPLRGLGRLLADGLITTRWAERALESLLPEEKLVLLQLDRNTYHWQAGMVAVHVFLFIAAALMVLWRQSITKATVRRAG
ncbi:MAG TPA: hypothetical protein VMG10_34955 [Gemmataceae bacterium]|nr:hypothetical protein [Gemmataceae bacterium]